MADSQYSLLPAWQDEGVIPKTLKMVVVAAYVLLSMKNH